MRFFILLFSFAVFFNTVQGQSVFEIECNLPGKTKQTGKALIVRGKYGDGFIRLSWKDSAKNESIITDFDNLWMYQQPLKFTDSSSLEYKKDTLVFTRAIANKNIKGKTSFPANDLILWFQGNEDTPQPYLGKIPDFGTPDYYIEYDRPADRWNEKPFIISDSVAIQSFRLLQTKDLNRELLANYFLPGELSYPFPMTQEQLVTIRDKNDATLYCITVTDDVDEKISKTTIMDRDNIQHFFGYGANVLNMKVRYVAIQGKDFNFKKVNSVVRNLKAGPNDIILFSYSGHGFSYSKDPAFQYPQLALWHGDKNAAFFRSNSINLETIFNTLRTKGARLTIVLGDCCNTDAGITRKLEEPEPPPPASIGMEVLIRRNYMRLLMEAEGAYIACAAKKGEPAAGDTLSGGFFTSNFTRILYDKVRSENNIDPQKAWSQILSSTRTTALNDAARLYCREFKGPCRQNLVFKKLAVKKTKSSVKRK